MSKRKKWILIISIPVLLIVVLGGGYATYLYKKTEDTVTDSHEDIGRKNKTSALREEKVDPVEDNVSVLL